MYLLIKLMLLVAPCIFVWMMYRAGVAFYNKDYRLGWKRVLMLILAELAYGIVFGIIYGLVYGLYRD